MKRGAYTEQWFGSFSAFGPIHHGSEEKTGNLRTLRRLVGVVEIDGKSRNVEVPTISGNSIRGMLRRKIMLDMLTRLDYGPTSSKLHQALHSGGVLDSSDDTSGSFDLPTRRKLQATIPALALLGTAVGNTITDGLLGVDFSSPFCQERYPVVRLLAATRPDLERYIDDPLWRAPVSMMTDLTYGTRRDDLRDETIESSQMIYQYETFSFGSKFLFGFTLRHGDDVARGALATMMKLWREDPFIGGRYAAGFGHIVHDDAIEWRDTSAYDEHLRQHGDEMRAVLDDIAKRLEGRAKPGTSYAELPI